MKSNLYSSSRFLSLLLTLFVVIASNLADAQIPSYVPTNGLIGYWPFSGNSNDESGNNNNGTVSGAVLASDRNNNANSCYDFNGQSNFIQCQPLLQLDNSPYMTLSCWFKIEGQNTNLDCVNGCAQYLMSQGLDGATGNSFFGLAYNQSVVPYAFGIANGYSNLFINSLAGTADFSSWNHLVLVFSFGVNKLYLNGSLVATNNYMGVISSPNVPLFFGMNNADSGYPYYLNGKLDEIGVWDRALSEAEVEDLFIGCSVSATLQPSDISVLSGNDASFTVAGSNANCTFQWQTDLGLGWQNLTNAGQYSGVNTSTLTVLNTNASNNNQNFRCLITLGTCSSSSSSAVLTVLPVSVTENENLSFSIFPNPATTNLTLQIESALIGSEFSIYDAVGNVVLKDKILSTNQNISISNLSNGNYILRVGNENKLFTVANQ